MIRPNPPTYKPNRISWITKALKHPYHSLKYFPPRLYNYLLYNSEWSILNPKNQNNKLMENKKSKIRLLMTNYHAWSLLHEYKFWEHDYIPNFSLKGKTILDIGAGSGDTPYFFFQHGANNVICIEKDLRATLYLRYNSFSNNWNTEILERPFQISDIEIPCDFIKMDIEGGEIELLNYPSNTLPPIILESHTNWLTKHLLWKYSDLKIKSTHPIYETKILSNCG